MTFNKEHYPLGIDVSKQHFDIALLRAEKFKNKKFPNNAKGFDLLQAYLAQLGVAMNELHACLESTGIYGEALATYLYDQGAQVSVVNGARIKGFAQSELSRTKTDKNDACVIARFCVALKPELWRPASKELRELKALVRRLNALKDMLGQEENRLESADSILLVELRSHIKDLNKRIEHTQQAIDEHIDNHPDLKQKRELLESIPGIGKITSATLLSSFADIENFSTAKKMAAFLGLTPRERQSGTSLRGRASLSRMGNRLLRKSLFFPALVAMKYNPIIKAMRERLLKAGKPKMLIVGAAMRKLVHIIYGVLKNRTPFNENLGAAIA